MGKRSLIVGGIVLLVLGLAWWALETPDEMSPSPEEALEPPAAPADEKPGDLPDRWPEGDEIVIIDGWDNDFDAGPTGPWRGECEVLVVDDASGAPIEGAEVYVAIRFADADDDPPFQTVTTDAEGRATAPTPWQSAIWLARKSGYLVARRVLDRRMEKLEFRLVASPPLRCRVVGAVDGRPIEGARVHLWKEGWSLETIDRELVTDADGRFEFPGRPPEFTVMIGVAADGFASVIVSCEPDAPADPFEIVLGEGGVVAGRVLGTEDRPIADAEVFVAERGGDDPLREARWDSNRDLHDDLVAALRNRTTSGEGGSYRIAGIAVPAEYLVHARAPDGAEGRGEPFVLRAAGEEALSDVRISNLAEILLRVVDAKTGEFVPPSEVRSSIDAEWTRAEKHQKAKHHPDPELDVFREVRPGRHVIYSEPRKHVTTRAEVEVGPGERKVVTLEVDPGVTISGRLVDENGDPVPAHVRYCGVVDGLEVYQSGMAGEDGRFEIRGVPAVPGTFFAWPDDLAAGEWPVTPGGDLGDLVLRGGPRIVARLMGVEDFVRLDGGVCYSGGGGRSGGLEVDDEGRVVFTHVEPDQEVRFFLRLEGRPAFVSRVLILKAAETVDLGQVGFPEPCTVRGTVHDSSGKPVPWAQLRVSEYWHEDTATADAEGRFEMTAMPPGRCHLIVSVKETPRAYVPVDVSTGMDPVVVRIPAQGTILATVKDGEGELVRNFPFNVIILGKDGKPDRNRRVIVNTDSRGFLRVDAVPGRWTLEPHPNRRRSLVTECPPIEVTDGNTTRVDLTLE